MLTLLRMAGSRLGRWTVGTVTALLAIITTLLLGRRQGRRAARREQEARNHEDYRKAVEARTRAEDDARRLPPGAAAGKLRDRWSRD